MLVSFRHRIFVHPRGLEVPNSRSVGSKRKSVKAGKRFGRYPVVSKRVIGMQMESNAFLDPTLSLQKSLSISTAQYQ